MHELSIAHAIVTTVLGHVPPGPDARVLSVGVSVGVLAGVVPRALQFCWDAATAGTPLEGARLQIERVPLEGRCLDCGATATTVAPPPHRCGVCAGPVLATSAGRELELTTVELDDGCDDGCLAAAAGERR